ncbi:MAG TPA: hypothetical protein VGS57_13300 [Thermoanaerobaculia bacterium]|jgi:O-antigen/teichoic acid export membrane protein|nr:hypothetical protein [Thermoanaerobaculia bacterium]
MARWGEKIGIFLRSRRGRRFIRLTAWLYLLHACLNAVIAFSMERGLARHGASANPNLLSTELILRNAALVLVLPALVMAAIWLLALTLVVARRSPPSEG